MDEIILDPTDPLVLGLLRARKYLDELPLPAVERLMFDPVTGNVIRLDTGEIVNG